MAAKDFGKAVLAKLFKDYRLNAIYASVGLPDNAVPMPAHPGFTSVGPSHLAAMEHSQTAKIRGSARYGRDGLQGFAIVDQGIPVCAAHFAAPAQYNRTGTWPIKQGQWALMDIATEESARGRGLVFPGAWGRIRDRLHLVEQHPIFARLHQSGLAQNWL
jgi:hypothetical protein